MKQITLNVSETVYEHVMFFLSKIDKKDIEIKETIYLSVAEKQQILDDAISSGISDLSVKDIKQQALRRV